MCTCASSVAVLSLLCLLHATKPAYALGIALGTALHVCTQPPIARCADVVRACWRMMHGAGHGCMLAAMSAYLLCTLTAVSRYHWVVHPCVDMQCTASCTACCAPARLWLCARAASRQLRK